MSTEETEETKSKQPSPKAAYERARRAEERVKALEEQVAKLTEAINKLLEAHSNNPVNIQATGLRPGQMIHNIIAEDEEGVTEEIICPTCGTREIRRVKIPTKIEIKEKPVIPDNYIPAPRSISEMFQLLESIRLPDGRTIFESDKFYQKLNEYLQKYGYEIKPKGGKK